MSTRKDLPNPNAPNFLPRVREEIHALLGKTGGARDRALTLADAINSGVIGVGPGGSLVPGPATGETYVPDLTPPPEPDTLTATQAISHILLEVPAATYTQGHGHLRTRVYGVTRLNGDPAPVFADAVEVGQFSGTVWAFPSNPSTTWHFWAKWESVDGVLSATPVGGTNGVVATTGQDVTSLVQAMTGPGNPFKVVTSETTLPDGSVVPPGTYTSDAYVHNGQITNAKIANLAVDDAKIADLSVSKLTAGSVAVGQYAQSTGYVAGSSGWRINGDGTAEFSGVVVRGTIFASQGAIGGWTIGSNYLQSTTYVLGTSGTRLNSDGTGQIGGITIYAQGLGAGSTAYDTGNGAWIGRDGKFSLKSATNSLKWDGSTLQINGGGTFSGALSAATGTFSGSLTASAVNAVNTINLAGNAVTVPVGVSASNTFFTSTSGYIILSASITTTGEPVIAMGTLNGGLSVSAYEEARILLRRNGTVLTYVAFRAGSEPYGSEISAPLTALDHPPTGTHTYDLQYIWSGAAGYGNFLSGYSRSIVLLSAKR